ncbi:MAG: hypothetical protein EoVTN8_508 [Fluviibacter phosphoraccumulans EoVTN8]
MDIAKNSQLYAKNPLLSKCLRIRAGEGVVLGRNSGVLP